jgi:hypothetical protein
VAREPIDVTGTAYQSVPCAGGCDEWVIAVPEYANQARCEKCLRRQVGLADFVTVEKSPSWFSATNPPPEPAKYEIGPTFSPFADVDPEKQLHCLECGENWPSIAGLTPEMEVKAFADHDRVAHEPDVWLIGPPGGAQHSICAPCGGGSPAKTPLEGGPDHGACLNGRTWSIGGRCDCVHRTRAQLDAIVGKSATRWCPPRWYEPKIVQFAAENTQKRFEQLELLEKTDREDVL